VAYLDGLAHFRNQIDNGPAAPGWASPVWGLAGYSPAYSTYDADFGASEDQVHRQLAGGVLSDRDRIPVEEFTLTRQGLVGAQRNSLPAAAFFQGHLGMGAGTGRAEAAGVAAWTPRSLHKDWNPGAQGAAELHPATVYNPYPSPAELYPKVV
jgi:hypothetical protein